jgi:CHAP domain.
MWICFFFLSGFVQAEDWHKLPDGICAIYAAQEFEKIAPAPGVNWLNENYDWASQAQQAGWVVRCNVREAVPGAIVEWQGVKRDGGHVAIVREVLADRIIVEEYNVGTVVSARQYSFGDKRYESPVTDGWGKATLRAIKYEEMLKMDDRKFMGYIWPVRQSAYDKEPDKYKVNLVEQMQKKEPKYKGFNKYWPVAYDLQEFDKIAPTPGVNWHGSVGQWVVAADQNGWETRTHFNEARQNAIAIWKVPEKDWFRVAIVDGVDADAIHVHGWKQNLRPYTKTISFSEKTDPEGFVFEGYIYPSRKGVEH